MQNANLKMQNYNLKFKIHQKFLLKIFDTLIFHFDF